MVTMAPPTPVVYAKLGRFGYMAGTSLDAIVHDAPGIFPDLRRHEIREVPESALPSDYRWSVRRVKEFDDWHAGTGTYLLVERFERYDSCKEYFPELRDGHRRDWRTS